MANPFYVDPSVDVSQGLAGLGDVLQQVGETRRQREAQETAQREIQSALQSGDLNQIHSVAAKYPQMANMLYEGMGATQSQQKARTLTRTRQLVSASSEERPQLLQRMIQEGEQQGIPMSDSLRELQNMEGDPESFDRNLKMFYSGIAPSQEFETWQQSTAGPEAKSPTGKLVQDYQAGIIDQEQLDQELKPSQSTAEFERLLSQSDLPEETKKQLIDTRLQKMASGNEGLTIETTPDGGTIIRQGGGQSLSPTEQRQLNDAEVGTRNFIQTVGDAVNMLDENPDINTFSARIASTVNNLQQEGKAIARSMDMEFDESMLDPSSHKETFDNMGIQNQRMRSLITSLAFQAAAASGQTGKAVSDRDVQRYIEEIGASSSDPRAFKQTLMDVAKRSARNFENNYMVRKRREFQGDLGLSQIDPDQETLIPEGYEQVRTLEDGRVVIRDQEGTEYVQEAQ